jgi:hypothetical protein
MNHATFRSAALDLLKNYWRIKAAIVLYRSSTAVVAGRLEYSNVPAVGVAANLFPSESVADAHEALDRFIAGRLPRELFLALVSELEGRIAARLLSMGELGDGTLGELQFRIQKKLSLAPHLIDDLNEIRERRNAMIHHANGAHAKYVAASTAVLPRAGSFVKAVVEGDRVIPTEKYLTYADDVMVSYSNAVG